MGIREVFGGIFSGYQADNKPVTPQKTVVQLQGETLGMDIVDQMTGNQTAQFPHEIRLGITKNLMQKIQEKTVPTEQQENTDNFVQNQGVIESSKEVIETAIEQPGSLSHLLHPDRVVSKEVKLKSGVTITENPDKHTVTIARNDGSGNPQTLAILEDASLQLPEKQATNRPEYPTFMYGLNPTVANHDDIVIQNKDIREIISPNGTITIEDNKRGIAEQIPVDIRHLPEGSGPLVLGAFSGLDTLDKWKADTYIITPDGQVMGKQLSVNDKSKPSILGKPAIKESLAFSELKPDGTFRVKKGNEEIIYKPFVAGEFVNRGS